MSPTANTSRAALQDLALLLDQVSQGLGSADFAVTLAVTAGAAVIEGGGMYQPQSIQRMTMNTLGQLQVQTEIPSVAFFGIRHAWGALGAGFGGFGRYGGFGGR